MDSEDFECGASYAQIYKEKRLNKEEGSICHYHMEYPDPTSVVDPSTIEEEEEEQQQQPPFVVVVHGPPKVGKTLLIKCLVSYYTCGKCSDMAGPIIILAGGKRRIQFVECPNNVNGMIDAAKSADAVIFLISVVYGIQKETFEFLELLKIHGMPKVMGVLTYLDIFINKDIGASTQERLVDQFQDEICGGAQVFCLSGLDNAMYLQHELAKLAAYMSREAEVLARRRQTPEQLGAVRIIESKMKLGKQLEFLEDDQKSRRLTENLIKRFKEYESRIPVTAIKNSGQTFVKHGSTCVATINSAGLLFSGDGLGTNRKGHVKSKVEIKVFFVGDRMLLSVAGNGFWVEYIKRDLLRVIADPDPNEVEFWNCERCAKFVFYTQSLGPEPVIEEFKEYNLNRRRLAQESCSMMFGAYENGQAKLFLADQTIVEQIHDAATVPPAEFQFQEVDEEMPYWSMTAQSIDRQDYPTFTSMSIGAGSVIANEEIYELTDLSKPNRINIRAGDLAELEEQLIVVLKVMKRACDKNDRTGGNVRVYHMPPPPEVAHVVYDKQHENIPMDIADKYESLYKAAVAADSNRANYYLTQFKKHSQ